MENIKYKNGQKTRKSKTKYRNIPITFATSITQLKIKLLCCQNQFHQFLQLLHKVADCGTQQLIG